MSETIILEQTDNIKVTCRDRASESSCAFLDVRFRGTSKYIAFLLIDDLSVEKIYR